jgi:hypothetical protein
MNTNELNNYINELNSVEKNELKTKLENYFLFNISTISFFKGINNQLKSLLGANSFDEVTILKIVNNDETITTLTNLKRTLIFIDRKNINEDLQAKYDKYISYIEEKLTLNEVDEFVNKINDLLNENEELINENQKDKDKQEEIKKSEELDLKRKEETIKYLETKRTEIEITKNNFINDELKLRKKIVEKFKNQNFNHNANKYLSSYNSSPYSLYLLEKYNVTIIEASLERLVVKIETVDSIKDSSPEEYIDTFKTASQFKNILTFELELKCPLFIFKYEIINKSNSFFKNLENYISSLETSYGTSINNPDKIYLYSELFEISKSNKILSEKNMNTNFFPIYFTKDPKLMQEFISLFNEWKFHLNKMFRYHKENIDIISRIYNSNYLINKEYTNVYEFFNY